MCYILDIGIVAFNDCNQGSYQCQLELSLKMTDTPALAGLRRTCRFCCVTMNNCRNRLRKKSTFCIYWYERKALSP